ncbi:hypothetical protein ACFV6Z_34585 [Streptomyces sp. NPDC059818]|uniref:hypothetical protein n=1 Tax=Streptomyces sp. NPDC059818 TaxID=3346962 RepID=UPI0036627019
MEESKGYALWPALPGFGGTTLLCSLLLSEGYHRRGVPLRRMAEPASASPARASPADPADRRLCPDQHQQRF